MRANALITGANKGIGLAIARKLAERGYAVWLGCRDRERGEAAASALRQAGLEADALLLDVTDDASVKAAASQLESVVPALDVLVNNAGMHFGFPPPAEGEPVEQMRTIFDTNVFGPVRVTQAFLPLLRKARGARIVMMTSGLGSLGSTLDIASDNWGVGFAGYSASKAALNMLTIKFAKELQADGIKVNAADPGLAMTDLTGAADGRTPEEAAAIAVDLATIGSTGPTGGFFFMSPGGERLRHPW